MSKSVVWNATLSRYELGVDGHTAFARCRREGGELFIDHVEAPPELRGAGAAGRLMQGMAEDARAQGLKMIPLCGYAAAWLKRNSKSD